MYFDNQKKISLVVPQGSTVQVVLDKMANICSRPDMFLQDGMIRPGVLVLINDQDWELLDEEEYVVQSGDNILFASTLHGG